MNTQEFVGKYVGECYAKIIKFIIVQLILDFLEIAVFVFMLIKDINEQGNLYVTIGAFIVVLMVTALLNVKLSFGGFKNFVKNVNLYRKYSDAVIEFQKTNDKETFDQALSELEAAIKK